MMPVSFSGTLVIDRKYYNDALLAIVDDGIPITGRIGPTGSATSGTISFDSQVNMMTELTNC